MDPVAQMKLEERRRIVGIDKAREKAHAQFVERIRAQVPDRVGKGAVLPITFYPDKFLSIPCAGVPQVGAELERTMLDMAFTMYLLGGVGLAANQVGLSMRAFVCDWSTDRKHPVFVVDPQVSFTSENRTIEREACLSIPGVRVGVERPTQIRANFTDPSGAAVGIDLAGWAARIFLHELDHLNGVSMLDYAGQLERRMAKNKLTKLFRATKRPGKPPKRRP